MTFADLRALHAIIGDAIDDIAHIYALASATPSQSSPASTPTATNARTEGQNVVFPFLDSSAYASPPPSPHVVVPSSGNPFELSVLERASDPHTLDFPSLDAPCDPKSPSELLTADPLVVRAINHIVAAAGQLSATVQAPFLSICDASMAYHLPSCIRLLEASHTMEILRKAGQDGLHVSHIAKQGGVEETKLAHALRLLATHHIVRETSPDVFAANRISSLLDSGKSLAELRSFEALGRPEMKYSDTNGIAAFTGMCTDEIHKASAYLTEAYLLSPSKHTREAREPTSAPFCFAFNTLESKIGFFNWLEGEARSPTGSAKTPFNRLLGSSIESHCGPGEMTRPARGLPLNQYDCVAQASSGRTVSYRPTTSLASENPNSFRLERFGKAMTGTGSWEAPGAIFNGFDWHALPKNSTIVDVGGGIGSTSMVLASAFSGGDSDLGLKFIVQDRPVVVGIGEKAWQEKCPMLLENGTIKFQVHDFFTPQPVQDAAVYLLRVVLHDWPDDFARQILLQLRYAANEDTKLLIADFVLPLACHDSIPHDTEIVEGATNLPVPAPLIANLGKASAMVYWMDLTMQVSFNAQERTLKEIVTLARSAGWRVVRVAKAEGSHFGHITALPAEIPSRDGGSVAEINTGAGGGSGEACSTVTRRTPPEMGKTQREIAGRAISRCGTPTFGSSTSLPSLEETIAKFRGKASKSRLPALSTRWTSKVHSTTGPKTENPSAPKKRPSPLSVLSPSPAIKTFSSPKPRVIPSSHARQSSQSNTRPQDDASTAEQVRDTSTLKSSYYLATGESPSPPQPTLSKCTFHAQPAPKAVPSTPRPAIARRASHAQLYKPCLSPAPPLPSSIPIRVGTEPVSPVSSRSPAPASGCKTPASKTPAIRRRSSCANLTQASRARASSVLAPPLPITGGNRVGMGLFSGNRGTRLQFDKEDHVLAQPCSRVTVLEAAAKIEKGPLFERSP